MMQSKDDITATASISWITEPVGVVGLRETMQREAVTEAASAPMNINYVHYLLLLLLQDANMIVQLWLVMLLTAN